MRKLSLVALLAAASLPACVASPSGSTDDTSSQVTAQLAQPNGGETTADEAPEFGEPEAFAAAKIEGDAPVADPLATDPTVAAIAASPDLEAHRVMIVWGKLPRDPGSTDKRDWSGQLAVSRGAMLVTRTIGFEPATDRLVPRTDPAAVAFDSVTRGYIDGLVVRVLEHDNVDGTPVVLTYTGAPSQDPTALPIRYSFDLSALEQGPVTVDAGNGYVMVAVALGEKSCNQGFMRGRWQALSPTVGVYRGIVTDNAGLPIGHVKGIYGPAGSAATAQSQMFGKFIDHEGHFIGLISGTFAGGLFNAKWSDKRGDAGFIMGHYVESTAVDGGAFFARFEQNGCPLTP